jgi:hypothetical protein
MRMRTRPRLPIGWLALKAPMKSTATESCSFESVLRFAVSMSMGTPADVALMPPAGGSDWQPHSASCTCVLRLVQESVILPTK